MAAAPSIYYRVILFDEQTVGFLTVDGSARKGSGRMFGKQPLFDVGNPSFGAELFVPVAIGVRL